MTLACDRQSSGKRARRRTGPVRWPEHGFVERHYPTRGAHFVARELGRLPTTVHAYAKRHGISVAEIPDHVRVPDLARLIGVSPSVVWHRALADGVLRTFRAATKARGPIRSVVPMAWADQYAEALGAQWEATTTAAREGWLSPGELAAAWGVGKSTVMKALATQRGLLGSLPEFRDARVARGAGTCREGCWLMHPADAALIGARLAGDRVKAKAMVSTKSLAVELGVRQGYMAELGRAAGGETLFVHSRSMCFVTPAVADELRARFHGYVNRRTHGRKTGLSGVQSSRG